MNPILHELHNKQWVWTATNAKQQQLKQKRISGFDSLDKVLSGGFPQAGTIHLQSPLGCGELRLMLSILQQQKEEQSEQKLYIFVNPPFELNAEFLLAHHITLEQLVIVQASTTADALWTSEQSLKSGACDAVFIWQQQLNHTQIKKLEVAAQQGQAYCIWLQSSMIQQHPAQAHTFSQHSNTQSNLPLSLSLSVVRNKEMLEIKVNKQKVGWAQGPVKVALPFKSRSKAILKKQREQQANNVIALHSHSINR